MTDYYDTRYNFDKGRAKVWRAIAEHLQRYVHADGTLLELGCGYADFINNVRAAKKIAVDLNPLAKKYCGEGVCFICGSVDLLHGVEDASVDTVFASNLLEHLDNAQLERAMEEIRRVTRSGARIIFLQPNYRYAYREYFDDYTHVKVFSHVSLADFLKAHGFTPSRVIPRFMPFTMKSLLPKSYLLTKLYLTLPFRPMGKQMLVVGEKD